MGPYYPLRRKNYLNTNNLAGKLDIGTGFGSIAGMVAINRRVYRITSDRSQIIEASLCVCITYR